MTSKKAHPKKILIAAIAVAIIIAAISLYQGTKKPAFELKELTPTIQNMADVIAVNGTVEPEKRIEINPPVNGRLEKIFFDEGDNVKAGDILAILSSTDRAALLDAARAQGPEKVAYWERVYNPTPLIAPTRGQIIVRTVEPGQSINTSTPVMVLADTLIIKAQVDETDIGSVKNGQSVLIALDAYPETKVTGKIKHISYESKIINNVTIYEVDIQLDKLPDFFRSGMSANVEIIKAEKKDALTIPESALIYKDNNPMVLVKDSSRNKYHPAKISLGINQNGQIEITEGITSNDCIIIKKKQTKTKQKASSFFKGPGATSRTTQKGTSK